ncbi:histone-lysine N-methyltransferase PRDM9 [Fundulus heteroclitus]|uniref:histone-lysine N-methyltransferase PRDM9 n=1 Tax=Fundulus heteroclitus TaxID=8078 RepID=UPI00165AE4A6|nr:histone-lysine N-methyltransferase PRDM9 [Fundulus heteroclitus]
MSSSQSLREFIRERLTAAAEEIFTEFDKTIVHYEEELDRQRRLLEISCKPHTNLQRIVLSQHYIWKEEEEVPTEHHICSQESNSSLDQEEPQSFLTEEELKKPKSQQIKENRAKLEPPQIKEEPQHPAIKNEEEQLYISLEKEQLGQQQSTDSFTVVAVYKETDHSEPESYKDQLIAQIFSESEKQKQERSNLEDSESSRDEENKSFQQMRCDVEDVVNIEVERRETVNTIDSISACKICGKSFAKKLLSDHMRIHTDEKPFSCLTGGKNFSNSARLYLRTRTDRDEKPFSCMTCGKCFNRKSNLTDHMKTHTGEKPFSCMTCGKRFNRKSNFMVHIKTHTGEKPFSCMTCGKTFSMKGNLSRHLKSHTGEKPFSCLYCGRNFRDRPSLSQHIKIHTGKKCFSV